MNSSRSVGRPARRRPRAPPAALVGDDLFWTSLYNTGYYTVFGVPVHLALALLAAVALNVRLRFVNFYRTMVYLPSITPAVASALVWIWIFNPDFGILNALLDL